MAFRRSFSACFRSQDLDAALSGMDVTTEEARFCGRTFQERPEMFRPLGSLSVDETKAVELSVVVVAIVRDAMVACNLYASDFSFRRGTCFFLLICMHGRTRQGESD